MHRSTKWLIAIIAIIFLMPLVAFLIPEVKPRDEAIIPHDIYKSLHVLGAVLFLGNIIITGVWMFLAEKSKSVTNLQFAARAVNWMDVFFTAPGAALILLTGIVQASHHGGLYTQSWITAGLILFSLSGIVWLLSLIPDQHRLIKLSEDDAIKGGKLPKKFFEILHRWYFWGIIAIILPLFTLLLMVFKPKLW